MSRFPKPRALRAAARVLSVCVAMKVLLMLLGACTQDSSRPPLLGVGYDPGLPAYADTSLLLLDEPPSPTRPGRFVTRTVQYRCEGALWVADSVLDTTWYAFSGDTLRFWAQGDCLASRLAGSGSGIGLVGTWTREAQDSVPEAYRPAICPAGEKVYPVPSQGSWEFSQGRVIFRTTGGFCLARLYADNLAAVLPGVEVSTGCDAVILSAGLDTAVVGSEMGDAGVRLRFAYGDRVCERMVAMASRPPTCPANAPEQAAFDECVTDFFVGVASTSRAMLEPGDREPPAQHSSSPQHQPEDPGEERPRTGEPPSPGDRDQDFLPGLPVKLPKIWML